MNFVQLHLALNHFPIVGLIIAGALLVYALWSGSREVRTIALVGIALSGLAILLVRFTGHEAAEFMERMPGIAESLVERHENAADLAGNLALVTSIAALLVLGLQRWAPPFARIGTLAVVVLVFASAAGVGWAGHLGGLIRHPELELVAGTSREVQTQTLLDARAQADADKSERGHSHDDDDDDDDKKH